MSPGSARTGSRRGSRRGGAALTAAPAEPGDPARDYLNEIGNHPLLTSAEELKLGLAVQAGRCLDDLRQAYVEQNFVEPCTLELGVIAFRELSDHGECLAYAGSAAGERTDSAQVPALVALPCVKAMLEGVPPRAVVEEAAGLSGRSEDDVLASIMTASNLFRLLPVSTLEDLAHRTRAAAQDQAEARDAARCLTTELLRDRWGRVEREWRESTEVLTNRNLRLVSSVARKFSRLGVPFLDLVQEGNLGLMRAVQKFQPQRGFKFSTYATWWIRQAVTRALAQQGRTIRLPFHVVERVQKLSRAERNLARTLDREPTREEIAGELGWAVEDLDKLLTQRQHTVSLQAPVGEDNTTLEDFVRDPSEWTPPELAIRVALREDVFKAIERLPGRLRRVVELRFGITGGRPRTLEEIGRELDLTRERIRQIEREALTRMRCMEGLPELLDAT